MKNLFIVFLLLLSSIAFTQVQPSIIECVTDEPIGAREFIPAKSTSQMKVVRINYHFMLKTDGTGNFNETTDGLGNSFSGYDYARGMTEWMYWRCLSNIRMNIPPGNTTPVEPKNFYFVTDAVYFHRNDATYNFGTISYSTQGADKDSVLNIFLSYSSTHPHIGGYANNAYANTNQLKFTENRKYWQQHVNLMNQGAPIDWVYYWGPAANTMHELCHLFGLAHTVKYDYGTTCGTGCANLVNDPPGANAPINIACDDGCLDTPTAWDITALNNCTKHPDCSIGHGGAPYCSNNIMDYSGDNALTPCQLNIVHTYLEGGMRSFNACAAVNTDKTYCDLGYPRVSYFGRNLNIGTCGTLATISSKEQLAVYFSGAVELSNFEIASDAAFEIVYEAPCGF